MTTTGTVDLLRDFNGGQKKKRRYTLDEDLAVMSMLKAMETNPQVTKEKISRLVGRPLASLTYRYGSEGRGVKQFTTLVALYESHKVEIPEDINKDVEERIANFKEQLKRSS